MKIDNVQQVWCVFVKGKLIGLFDSEKSALDFVEDQAECGRIAKVEQWGINA